MTKQEQQQIVQLADAVDGDCAQMVANLRSLRVTTINLAGRLHAAEEKVAQLEAEAALAKHAVAKKKK